MPYSLDDMLVVAVTSRALFDLEDAHEVYRSQGLSAYRAYQRKREEEPLNPGTGFPLVKALLNINDLINDQIVEVVLFSKNDAESGLRILKSISHHRLQITRSSFTDGADHHGYLPAYACDLLLSKYPEDVRAAIEAGTAAGLVYPPPTEVSDTTDTQVRIAFDGDAVLFSADSENIFRSRGLDEFQRHEDANEDIPLDPGPFKAFLEAISRIQSRFPDGESPIRTALVTARNGPADIRVIKTLREWGVTLDESHFLGGLDKTGILKVFKPHIFFDDQVGHIERSSNSTPSAHVPSSAGTPEKLL